MRAGGRREEAGLYTQSLDLARRLAEAEPDRPTTSRPCSRSSAAGSDPTRRLSLGGISTHGVRPTNSRPRAFLRREFFLFLALTMPTCDLSIELSPSPIGRPSALVEHIPWAGAAAMD
jgi:hypothetical protein